MRPLSFVTASIVACVLQFAPGASPAQELRLGAVQGWLGNERLGNPTGLTVAVGARAHARIGVRLAYEQTWDRFHTFGSTCVGLIPPDGMEDCAAERQTEAADFHAVVLSMPVSVLAVARLEVALTPAFRWSWFESRREGLRSGRRLNGDESMWGFGIGTDVTLQPSPRHPVRLFLGAHAGVLGQTEYLTVADGYSPFDEGFSLVQLEMGVAVRR